MKADAVLRTLQEQRRFWVEVGEGAAIQLRRPTVSELPRFFDGITVEMVLDYVVGWRGVTSRIIIGAAGDDDAVAFESELAREWLRDEPKMMAAILTEFASRVERAAREKVQVGNA